MILLLLLDRCLNQMKKIRDCVAVKQTSAKNYMKM